MIFWCIWIFTVLQRLLELRHSEKNRKKLSANGFSLKESVSSYREMVWLHVLWFVSMALEAEFLSQSPHIILQITFAALFIFAQFIRLWAITSLGQHWNTCVMAPDSGASNESFVISGPYRFIRHPNYLAAILEIAFLPLIAGAWLTSIIFTVWNGLVLRKRIGIEEQFLNSRPGYSEAFKNQNRFIPNLFN